MALATPNMNIETKEEYTDAQKVNKARQQIKSYMISFEYTVLDIDWGEALPGSNVIFS
jgi:hypothetical protein